MHKACMHGMPRCPFPSHIVHHCLLQWPFLWSDFHVQFLHASWWRLIKLSIVLKLPFQPRRWALPAWVPSNAHGAAPPWSGVDVNDIMSWRKKVETFASHVIARQAVWSVVSAARCSQYSNMCCESIHVLASTIVLQVAWSYSLFVHKIGHVDVCSSPSDVLHVNAYNFAPQILIPVQRMPTLSPPAMQFYEEPSVPCRSQDSQYQSISEYATQVVCLKHCLIVVL